MPTLGHRGPKHIPLLVHSENSRSALFIGGSVEPSWTPDAFHLQGQRASLLETWLPPQADLDLGQMHVMSISKWTPLLNKTLGSPLRTLVTKEARHIGPTQPQSCLWRALEPARLLCTRSPSRAQPQPWLLVAPLQVSTHSLSQNTCCMPGRGPER